MALTNEDLKAIGSLMDEKLDSRFIPVERRLSAIEVDVSRLKSDMIEVKGDVAELKSDMIEVKSDVAELKNDMIEVKSDVAELKNDMIEVKSDVAELKNDMIEVKGDVAELKSDVAAIKTDVAQTQKTVNKHYQMFEESYVHQAEENTRVWNQFRIIAAQLEMQSKQIEFNNVRLNNG